MTDFLTAAALVLVLEGAAYAIIPGPIKRMMATAIGQSDMSLRSAGLVAAGIGVALVWLIRG
jgi:hypothetical protein